MSVFPSQTNKTVVLSPVIGSFIRQQTLPSLIKGKRVIAPSMPEAMVRMLPRLAGYSLPSPCLWQGATILKAWLGNSTRSPAIALRDGLRPALQRSLKIGAKCLDAEQLVSDITRFLLKMRLKAGLARVVVQHLTLIR
ncbi:hypothetical protein [Cylindrospermum stagnale]|uniref:hypothetical protein n=1 Tax=Cylindrospermum stagnale TaxID=142864 RepID=UPI0012F65FF0|nr:hypothetical protein [Cylindrospermum stagnale]